MRRYEVAPAHVRGVEPDLAGAGVDEPFEQHRRLRAAGAAIDADGSGVRDHRANEDVRVADRIRPGQDAAGVPGRDDGAERQPGAEREGQIRLHGQDPARRIEGHAPAARSAAPVRRGEQILPASGDPAHRPAQITGREGDGDVLGVDRRLHPESAADVGGDRPHLARVEPQGTGNVIPRPMRRLGPGPDRQALRLPIPLRQRRAALQRRGRDARMPDRDLDGGRRLAEGGLRIAAPPALLGHDVAGGFREQGRSIDRRLGIADRLQRFEIHVDPIGRVKGRGLALGRDGDDGLACGPHLIPGQYRPVGWVDVPQNGVDPGPRQAGDVPARIDSGNPRHLPRGFQMERSDFRAGEGAADEHHREATGDVQVGDVTAAAGQQPFVFAPVQGFPETTAGGIGRRRLLKYSPRIAAFRVHRSTRWFGPSSPTVCGSFGISTMKDLETGYYRNEYRTPST